MTKDQVYVVVDTPEKCKEAYRILTEAGELMDNGAAYQLSNAVTDGVVTIVCRIPLSSGLKWGYCHSDWGINKTKISLPELEQILLGGKPITKHLNTIESPLEIAEGQGYINGDFCEGLNGHFVDLSYAQELQSTIDRQKELIEKLTQSSMRNGAMQSKFDEMYFLLAEYNKTNKQK